MWRIARLALLTGIALLFLSCNGDNGGQGPGGGGEETVLSSVNRDDWTFDDSCYGGPLWEDGVFRVVATPLDPPGCETGGSYLIARPESPDVRQYSSVRARFSVKLELNSPASGDGQAYAAVYISARETDVALTTYFGYWSLRDLGAQSFEEDFDISLDSEEWDWWGHVYLDVQLSCYVRTADGACLDRAVAEIQAFRIVGQR